ncbi:MAG: rhomboid family intramembrane serine protease [Oscillospiraceae bacterium]|nr:rhomboid family intramembrane serine protease [Oscillospiraceae bacterium]
MKKTIIKLQYNSPVVLTFSFLSLVALLLGKLTGGYTTVKLFSVYRSSLADVFTYLRFFLHVLGHSSYSHLIGNIMFILVLGPALEERYGSHDLLMAILITAFVSGLIQWLFFPGTALLGASGIVFMMIVMMSLSGMKNGCIPITLILVLVLYIGGEIIDGVVLRDNVSQLTHIVGGICGAVLGINLRN